MISYLIDGVLLVAVIAAGVGIALLYRQLRRLRAYHKQYQRVFAETGYAVGAIDNAVRDINAHGAQILLSLGHRIDEAHKLIGEIDERMEAIADHFEAQREAASNVVRFAEPRRGRPAVHERMEEEEEQEIYRAPAPARVARQPERPVQWPTLGDRFSQWRSSEEQPGWKAAGAGRRWQ